MSYFPTVEDAAARAARDVPHNPRELCRDFVAKPAPAAFWCARCGWNELMHGSEITRAAIAAELQRLAGCAGPKSAGEAAAELAELEEEIYRGYPEEAM